MDNLNLFNAIQKFDNKNVQNIINQGVPINSIDKNGYTPLMVAAKAGNNIALKILLEQKADPNITKKNGDSPLKFAALWAHKECIKILLFYGAYPLIVDQYGSLDFFSIGLYRMMKTHNGIEGNLIQECKTLIHQQRELNNTLIYSVSEPHYLQTLINQKAQINSMNEKGINSLIEAAIIGNVESIKILLHNKANHDLVLYSVIEDDQNIEYRTRNALLEAALHGHKECVELFIEKCNMDPLHEYVIRNPRMEIKRSALQVAVQLEHFDTTKMILEYAYKKDLQTSLQKVSRDYFESLPQGIYKTKLKQYIIYCLCLKKLKNTLFHHIPKPVFLIILNKSITPYFSLLRQIFDKKYPGVLFSNTIFNLSQSPKMQNLLLHYKNKIPNNDIVNSIGVIDKIKNCISWIKI